MRADLAKEVARQRAWRRRQLPLGAEPRRPTPPTERPAPRVHKQQLQHKDKRKTGHVKDPAILREQPATRGLLTVTTAANPEPVLEQSVVDRTDAMIRSQLRDPDPERRGISYSK